MTAQAQQSTKLFISNVPYPIHMVVAYHAYLLQYCCLPEPPRSYTNQPVVPVGPLVFCFALLRPRESGQTHNHYISVNAAAVAMVSCLDQILSAVVRI